MPFAPCLSRARARVGPTTCEIAAKENVVSPKPSPLFWFTGSEAFTTPQPVTVDGRPRQLPRYLQQPEIIFQRLWHPPTPSEKPFNLAD